MATKQKFSWDYSINSDILNIHKSGTKVAGSAEAGDFTIDFAKDGSTVGVEIVNASEFLGHLGTTKEQLTQLKSAELQVVQKQQYAVIWVHLVLQEKEEMVALPAMVMEPAVSAVA